MHTWHTFVHIFARVAGAAVVIALILAAAFIRQISKPNGWNG